MRMSSASATALLITMVSLGTAQVVLAKEGDQTREFKNGCKVTCIGGDWSQNNLGHWACSTGNADRSAECPTKKTTELAMDPRRFQKGFDASGATVISAKVKTRRDLRR